MFLGWHKLMIQFVCRTIGWQSCEHSVASLFCQKTLISERLLMKRKVSLELICRPCCIQLCFWLWSETLRCVVSDAAGHRNVKLKKTVFDDCCCHCFFAVAGDVDDKDVKQDPVTGDLRAVSSVCLLITLLHRYAVSIV